MIDAIGRTGKLPLVFAVGFAVVLGAQGLKAHRTLAEKAQGQRAVTESVLQWKQSYLALADTGRRWEAGYRREETIPDMLSLHRALELSEYGLRTESDSLILHQVKPVTQNGIALGLTQVCLASAGAGNSAQLELQAANYQALFAGLKRLSDRQDIQIGTIALKGGDKAMPIAYLGDFCVLLRQS